VEAGCIAVERKIGSIFTAAHENTPLTPFLEDLSAMYACPWMRRSQLKVLPLMPIAVLFPWSRFVYANAYRMKVRDEYK